MGLGDFSPLDISTIELWMDSKFGITKDGSNNVSSWVDRTGNHEFIQGTGSAQPTWIDNQVNGYPVIEFNGTTDIMKKTIASFLSGSNTFTVFVMFKYVSGTNNTFFGTADEGVANSFLTVNTSSSNDLTLVQANDTAATDVVEGSTVMVDGVDYYYLLESDGSEWTFRVNGSDETENVVAGLNDGLSFSDIPNRDNITLGGFERSTLAYGKPKTVQFGIYSAKIPVSDRTLLEAYLSNQSGV